MVIVDNELIGKTIFFPKLGRYLYLFVSFLSLKDWVKGIRKLKIPPPLKLMGLTDFTEEDKNKILGLNAAKVLGL